MSFLDIPKTVYKFVIGMLEDPSTTSIKTMYFKYQVDGEEHELHINFDIGHGTPEATLMADHLRFVIKIEKPHMFYFKGVYESAHDDSHWMLSKSVGLNIDAYTKKTFRKTTFWWLRKDFNDILDHHLMILTLLINESI